MSVDYNLFFESLKALKEIKFILKKNLKFLLWVKSVELAFIGRHFDLVEVLSNQQHLQQKRNQGRLSSCLLYLKNSNLDFFLQLNLCKASIAKLHTFYPKTSAQFFSFSSAQQICLLQGPFPPFPNPKFAITVPCFPLTVFKYLQLFSLHSIFHLLCVKTKYVLLPLLSYM